MRDIGKNIRQLRKERHMTQEELAEALFITRQTVSNYETGKSRPDIDMLLQIGQVLETDINTLVYGPPIPEDQQRSRRWAIVSGAIVAVLAAVYAVLYPYCIRQRDIMLFPTPLLLLRLIVLPVLMFVLGWFVLHCVGLALKLKPVDNRATKVLRIIFLVLLGLVVVIPAPYVVWLAVGLVQKLVYHSVNMRFADIPVYTQVATWVLYGLIKWPFAMTVLGGICRLLGIPYKKR